MKKIKKGRTYHIPTIEAYNDFMITAEKQGYIWLFTKNKPTQRPSVFHHYGKNTIIECDADGEMVYGNLQNRNRYEVIEWKVEDTRPLIVGHLIRGNKTIVKLSNGKVGVARCHPDDTFDIYEGLRVATARAYGKPVEEPKVEPKKDVLKVKCVWVNEGIDWWTVGKVYERVDGLLMDDDGCEWIDGIDKDDPTKWAFINVKFELYEEPNWKLSVPAAVVNRLEYLEEMVEAICHQLDRR